VNFASHKSVSVNPKIHRVLGAESRQTILDLLQCEARPLHASEVAHALGHQRNTARVHLELLCSIGLVRRVDEDRLKPGRPRVMYEFVPSWSTSSGEIRSADALDYKGLSQLLIAGLEATGDVAEVARQAGVRWAQAVGDGHEAGATLSSDQAFVVLTEVLTRLGFDPEPDLASERITLHRCPFEDMARDHRSVICAMHLGMIQAAAAQSGSPLEVVALNPFVSDDPLKCVVELVSKEPSPGGALTQEAS
jgi:predicted ArsR family transcriptional regulator